MPKSKPRKKTKTTYQRDLDKLKAEKAKVLKAKNELVEKNREAEEIRNIKRDIAKLKGVGTKRAVMKRVGKKIGSDAGRVGWKGLKVAGKFVKNVVEAEARAQDLERAAARQRQAPKRRPAPKRKTPVKRKTPQKRRKKR